MTDATVIFDIQTPATKDVMGEHIAYALSLGLSHVQPNTHSGRVSLLANGPSARTAGPINGPLAAVNGAIGLCDPEWFVICDPKQDVTRFLPHVFPETQVLAATKCHPDVFEDLIAKGHTPHIYAIDDYPCEGPSIPSAVSVTLTTMSLLRFMGFTHIDVYGWDGCIIDGQMHAIPQDTHTDFVTVHLPEGQQFNTTRPWAAEGQDAVNQLSCADYTVSVHGPGYFGALLRHFGLIEHE